MSDYTLVRDDHPDNVKRRGVSIYYKSCLPLHFLNISQLNEWLILEIKLNIKSAILSTLQRLVFQFTDEFDNFLSKFEENLFSIISKKNFLNVFLENSMPSHLDDV